MFFIGLFASPLPYLVLTVIYLSGYAWCCFQQDVAGSADQADEKVVQVAPGVDDDPCDDGTFFWLDQDQLLADHSATLPLNTSPPVFISPFLALFYPQAPPACHRVRPPPEACKC